jgi:hypothetical protein
MLGPAEGAAGGGLSPYAAPELLEALRRFIHQG